MIVGDLFICELLETVMRRKIIEAMTYPRMLMMSRMDLRDCPMNRYFNAEEEICRSCNQDKECRWLNSNDEFSVLAEQPMEVLFEAFSFSIDYVDAHVSRTGHNSRRCTCDSCCWVKNARHLARQYKGKSVSAVRPPARDQA
jgi:hypothetical protein